jgi:hypothetical protein
LLIFATLSVAYGCVYHFVTNKKEVGNYNIQIEASEIYRNELSSVEHRYFHCD